MRAESTLGGERAAVGVCMWVWLLWVRFWRRAAAAGCCAEGGFARSRGRRPARILTVWRGVAIGDERVGRWTGLETCAKVLTSLPRGYTQRLTDLGDINP